MALAAAAPATGRQTGRLRSMTRDRRWALIASYACLILFAVMFLFPVYYMLITSLKTNAEIAALTTNPWIIEEGVTFEHYWDLLANSSFLIYFKNTAIVAVVVVVVKRRRTLGTRLETRGAGLRLVAVEHRGLVGGTQGGWGHDLGRGRRRRSAISCFSPSSSPK